MVLRSRPLPHRRVPHQSELALLGKYKARFAVREPADVSEYPAEHTVRRADQMAMKRPRHWSDERSRNALRRCGFQFSEGAFANDVADKEARIHLRRGLAGVRKKGRARAETHKPAPAQIAAGLGNGPEAAQVWFAKGTKFAQPELTLAGRSALRGGFPGLLSLCGAALRSRRPTCIRRDSGLR